MKVLSFIIEFLQFFKEIHNALGLLNDLKARLGEMSPVELKPNKDILNSFATCHFVKWVGFLLVKIYAVASLDNLGKITVKKVQDPLNIF